MNRKIFTIIIGIVCVLATGSLWFFYQPMEKMIPDSKVLAKMILPSKENRQQEIILPVESNVSLWLAGDIMLDRNVAKKTRDVGANNYDFPFLQLGSSTEHYDFRIANLEGPVTNNRSIVSPTNLSFTFSPNYLDSLAYYFDVVDLANNHTHNFGRDGLEQTHDYLDQSGIKYFGDPYNTTSSMSLIIEKDDIKIGLVGFSQLIGYGFEDFITEIKNLRSQVDYLIAFPHWGIEYNNTNPGKTQKTQAYRIIDAGADIIIGTHPHVIQPIEIYNNKFIFYSLGNFVFDQYFSPETMQGLTVDLNLNKKEGKIVSTLELLPIKLNIDYQPYFVSGEDKQKILDFVADNSWVDDVIKEKIKLGNISF